MSVLGGGERIKERQRERDIERNRDRDRERVTKRERDRKRDRETWRDRKNRCERESRKRSSLLIYNFSVPLSSSCFFICLPCSFDTQKIRRGTG